MSFVDTTQLRSLSVAFLFVAAFAATGVSQGAMPNPLQDASTVEAPQEASTTEGIGYTGVMRMELQRDTNGDGEYETVKSFQDENQIVDQGLNFFECKVAGVSCDLNPAVQQGDYAKYISVAIDSDNENSLSQGATSLTNEISNNGGLDRKEGTVVDEGTGYYSVEYTFTATQDFTQEPGIDHTGLHWTGTEGESDLVAQNTFPGVTMLADDKLTVSWVEVSFNRP